MRFFSHLLFIRPDQITADRISHEHDDANNNKTGKSIGIAHASTDSPDERSQSPISEGQRSLFLFCDGFARPYPGFTLSLSSIGISCCQISIVFHNTITSASRHCCFPRARTLGVKLSERCRQGRTPDMSSLDWAWFSFIFA